MIYVIGCSCGGTYKASDTRQVGLSVIHWLRCDECGGKQKLVKPLDASGKRIPDLILDSSNSDYSQHATQCHDDSVPQQ